MDAMRKPRAALALAAVASLLPGCFAARSAFGTNAQSLAYAGNWFGRTVADQWEEFGDHIAGAPSALGGHCAECWKNITTDPRDLPH
jgi:hypothetical protein